ncbi:small subunit ribosomal protein S1 [Nitratiruptor sp. YY08-26]|uniref:30S ribosomal protein S1 n=1 Tax=unclassified Nitratiruptor TaxID=2624044 RepID=UPI001915EAE2|nr:MULTISPECIES: 30S ribosomal protein S1 [unclassified Nitratiruptor]BCD61903.1 small subunit ribosomal protein S1 [Nitratiruptor sp. YY08-13]BCD65838.1 small subunit ribosomal protein S1 [Nitratiruptor sp. YY08-26]
MEKEVNMGMENTGEDFAKMLEEHENKRSESRVIDGVIVEIQDNERVLVDVGEKQEGILNIKEIQDSEGNLLYQPGDTIKVMVSGYRNERPIISHKKAITKEKVKSFIEANRDNLENMVIEGRIVGKNRGGYIVENDEGVQFFLPNSQSFFKNKPDIGRRVSAKILKIGENNDSIVISRKKFIQELAQKRKEIIDELMQEDKVVEGTVKKITNYGMFVEVAPGVEGLVHYNEISYKGPVNPAKYFNEGDKVNVKAINYESDKNRLSLSIKATQPDPWEEIKGELELGDVINVTISNIEPYGAFVDLGNDIEGLLHISEMTWEKKPKHPSEYVKEGEQIDVEVTEIDIENRKLRVSLKNLLPKPFEEFLQNYKEGDVVEGEITSLTDFGAFVKIGAIEGLLHNQDLGWEKGLKAKDLFNVGDTTQVKIVRIDREKERVSLDRKSLQESPLEKFAKTHKVGDIVKGTVRDIKDFGVFIQLEDGVDALVRNEDLAPLKKEELNKGDEIEGVISYLDTQNNRLRVSVRRLQKMKEKEALREINQEESTTLGDIIKEKLDKQG